MKMNIKNTLLLSLVLTFSLLNYSASYAQISVVVAKSSSQNVSIEEAKAVFSGVKVTWTNGNKVAVVDQAETEVGKQFYSDYLKKNVNQIRMQWTKLVLSGQASAPTKTKSDDEVKSYVSKNPDAIGYILSNSLDASVKELFKISK